METSTKCFEFQYNGALEMLKPWFFRIFKIVTLKRLFTETPSSEEEDLQTKLHQLRFSGIIWNDLPGKLILHRLRVYLNVFGYGVINGTTPSLLSISKSNGHCIVLRSIMSCGGPAFFLQRSSEDQLLLARNGFITSTGSVPTSTQNALHRISCRDDPPDPQTVKEWLQNGRINRDKLQDVKEDQLRKLMTTCTRVQPLTRKSSQAVETPKSEPSKESWAVNPSKLACRQQSKFEDSEEGNLIKEALQGLIIGLSSAVLFCSILIRFVLKN